MTLRFYIQKSVSETRFSAFNCLARAELSIVSLFGVKDQAAMICIIVRFLCRKIEARRSSICNRFEPSECVGSVFIFREVFCFSRLLMCQFNAESRRSISLAHPEFPCSGLEFGPKSLDAKHRVQRNRQNPVLKAEVSLRDPDRIRRLEFLYIIVETDRGDPVTALCLNWD